MFTYRDGVLIHCEQSAAALVEMFVWLEVPISMRVEWRCASMTSGGQCVMTGTIDACSCIVCKQLGYTLEN